MQTFKTTSLEPDLVGHPYDQKAISPGNLAGFQFNLFWLATSPYHTHCLA